MVYYNVGNMVYAFVGSAFLLFLIFGVVLFLCFWKPTQDFMLRVIAWGIGITATSKSFALLFRCEFTQHANLSLIHICTLFECSPSDHQDFVDVLL
jgi:hypothetical protein